LRNVTARRQLTDEVAQRALVLVAACFGAQRGDGVLGGLLPVGEELLRRRIQEGETRGVGRSASGSRGREAKLGVRTASDAVARALRESL
jgi:hypothetical protein